MKKIWVLGIILLLLPTIVIWGVVGVYRSCEPGCVDSSTYYLFIKHRPSLQLYFSATSGESTNTVENTAEAEQNRVYWEFVYEHKGYAKRIPLW